MILHGDCLEHMRGMGADSVDAIVCDPPYGLSFMGKRWDYDVPSVEVWREALRVLKPGGHLLAFGGTRTYHRMVVNIEDAGFDIRDQLQWLYGSGFPKSHNVAIGIDKAAGAMEHRGSAFRTAGAGERADIQGKNGVAGIEQHCGITDAARQWDGWGTALKPANEPICMARKPIRTTVAANVLEHGTGAINVDACRIDARGRPHIESKSDRSRNAFGDGLNGSRLVGTTDAGRWPANVTLGCACEVEHEPGCAVALLDAQSGERGSFLPAGKRYNAGENTNTFGRSTPHAAFGYGDTGGASRFYYVAKASKAERNMGCEDLESARGRMCYDSNYHEGGGKLPPRPGNTHPTVKPVAVMRWLVRLVTPPGGLVLDPFAGSGTTGIACVQEGFRFVGIEREAEYCELARRRIAAAVPDQGDLLDAA